MSLLGPLLAGGWPMHLAGWATPRAGEEHRALRYGAHARHLLDLTLPERVAAGTPLVVFFHGGAWQSGSRTHYAFLARMLAREGFAVALPDYRLWPGARWPDFLEDAALALAWLRMAPEIPRGPLFVMGHSAGGFIAASLALDPRWLAEAGMPEGRAALAGGVLVSAPVAWQPDDEPIRSIFAQAPGGRIQAVPDETALRGAPPLLLVHGRDDTVVGPFHSERLAHALRQAGTPAELLMTEGAHLAPMVALSEPARRYGWTKPDVWEALLRFLRGAA
ncbi:alpha/beta hydrolase [Falsiroseomonas oryziterrae]|uniref:alpha/beta hydrolase n=1 Tax=Falsiroseomonas oryziterrae TaxID=2911368 RepID=UPI001F18A039|nr:alpha/beta hydrolase [Roseomonas sp. NPKOSM-4]